MDVFRLRNQHTTRETPVSTHALHTLSTPWYRRVQSDMFNLTHACWESTWYIGVVVPITLSLAAAVILWPVILPLFTLFFFSKKEWQSMEDLTPHALFGGSVSVAMVLVGVAWIYLGGFPATVTHATFHWVPLVLLLSPYVIGMSLVAISYGVLWMFLLCLMLLATEVDECDPYA